MPMPCARCEMPLSRWEPDTGDARCTLCGARNSVRAFPAILADTAVSRPESAMEGEAACFDHPGKRARSEEHTSELQSPCNLVCRLLLEKKKRILSYSYYLRVNHSRVASFRRAC